MQPKVSLAVYAGWYSLPSPAAASASGPLRHPLPRQSRLAARPRGRLTAPGTRKPIHSRLTPELGKVRRAELIAEAARPACPRQPTARIGRQRHCQSSGSYGSTSIAPANVTRADVAFPLAALSGGMATMRSWIDHAGEVVWEPAPSLIAQLVEAGQPFWLDIEDPTDELIDQLATRLGLHPLAVEDSKQFGQRAKLQVYGNGVMLVGFGLDEQLREPVEVHCYYTTGFLITLRRAPSPALDALRQAGSVQPQLGSDPIRALHPLISSLYTQFSALALELDERLDALEQRVLHEADDQELAEITAIRRRAAVTRRILTPGRDLAARTPLIQSLPGATSETQLYAEDINDELQQVVADLTAIEERCAALLVLHASLASKHLAVVSRRLADVATIFLPISFLAGFWGQNFDVLTGSIEKGWPAFLVLGVGLSVACVAVIVFMLSRRSWK